MLRAALLLFLSVPVARAQALPPGVELGVGGTFHADARAFPSGPVGGAPGFLLRRARVEVAVRVGDRFRAVVEPGFGEGEVELVDGYLEADLAPALGVRVGRFKTPVGYESLRSSSDLRFAERALPTALSPRRDLGAVLAVEVGGFEAQAGLFNGVPDGSSASVEWGGGPDVVARAFGTPVAVGSAAGALRLGLGLAVAAGTASGAAGDRLADYETPGERTFFGYAQGVAPAGRRLRLAPQATLDLGRLHVLGEYLEARHRVAAPGGPGPAPRDLTHRAWQVAASVVVVGLPQGEGRPVPRRAATDGGAGAVEVSARVHALTVDPGVGALAAPGSARRATAWGLAAHWSPVVGVRLGVTAERTAFGAFAAPAGGPTPRAETLVAGRFQVDL